MQLTVNKNVPGNENQPVVLLRGIAAAMVCIFHLTNGNTRLLPDGNFTKWIGSFGFSGVEIFFVISGFVIPLSMYNNNYTIRNFFTFFQKRLVRIEPPYLLSVLLMLLLAYISSVIPGYRGNPFSINWLNVAGHIAYLNVFTGDKWLNDVYWTLAIEFQYYLIIALSFFLIASDKLILRLIFFVPFITFHLLHLSDTNFIFNYTAYFILGILLFQYCSSIILLSEYLLLTAVCLLLLYIKDGTFFSILSLITVVTILFIKRIPVIFSYAGLISYSLYLTHVPVGGRVINFIEAHVQNIMLRQAGVLLAFIVSIVFASLFYQFIEKRCKVWASAIRY